MAENSSPILLKAEDRRIPLRREEVPLPPGGDFSLDLLIQENKDREIQRYVTKKRAICEERAILHEKCRTNPEYRALVYERCRRDSGYFTDYFAWTYDDRTSRDEPFILYDFQNEKIVVPYEHFCRVEAPERVTLGIAKSRGIGATWVIASTRTRNFLLWDNWSILLGCENRDDVDDGGMTATHQSFMGKIRYIIDHLPKWFRDDKLGPLWENEQYNKRWAMRNPKKPRNLIDGKQLGSMFGRQRRYSEAVADEAAWADEMTDADTSIKQTTNRFCFLSTPHGIGNFFDKAMNGGLPGVVKFWLWWAEQPFYDLDWYNTQRSSMSDDAIAQELDISFTLSVGGRVLSEVNLSWFIDIPTAENDPHGYDPRLDLEVVIDPGYADALACKFSQWNEIAQEGRVIDYVQVERKAIDWVVPFILGEVPAQTYRGEPWKHTYTETEHQIIARHKRWGPPKFVYGDAAGGAKQSNTGTSSWDELARYNIFVDEIKITNDEEALKLLELFIRHVKFAKHLLTQRNGPKQTTPTFMEVVTQWRYPKRIEGQGTSGVKRPVHDRYCHGGDTLKMWAQVHDLPDSIVSPTSSGRIMSARGSDIIEGDTESPFRR